MVFSVTRFHGQLSSCTISGKTYDPILRKFSNAWADKTGGGWTDGLIRRPGPILEK